MKNKMSWVRLFMLGILLVGWGVLYAQNQRTVTGTVRDSNDEPLIGVSIMLKGTSTGTVTDMDGNYSVGVNSDVSWKKRQKKWEAMAVWTSSWTTGWFTVFVMVFLWTWTCMTLPSGAA